MKEKLKENKKIAIIIAVALVILIAIICALLFSKKSNEEILKVNMEKIGKTFYEDYYYPSQEKSQEDVKAFLEKFQQNGIKINLTNLAKVSKIDQSLINDMVNAKTKKKCDFDKTYVTIYPKKPFKKDSYKMKVDLDCGFEKKK